DVKESQRFLRVGGAVGGGEGVVEGRVVPGLVPYLARREAQVRIEREQRGDDWGRSAAEVGEDDDGELQPFRLVDRHQADDVGGFGVRRGIAFALADARQLLNAL